MHHPCCYIIPSIILFIVDFRLVDSWIITPSSSTSYLQTSSFHRQNPFRRPSKVLLLSSLVNGSEQQQEEGEESADDDDDDVEPEPKEEESMNAQQQISALQTQIQNALRTNNFDDIPPSFDSYYSFLTLLLEEEEEKEENDQEYEVAASALEFSLTYMDANNDAIRERLAYVYRKVGRFREAASHLRMVLFRNDSLFFEEENKKEEKEMMMDGETLAWLYLDLASILEEIKPLPGTSYNWDEITGVCPSVSFPSTSSSSSSQKSDDDDNNIAITAQACIQRAIKLHSENGEAHKRLADLYVALGLYDEGLKEFEMANELFGGKDICCLTHSFYGNEKKDGGVEGGEKKRKKKALPMVNMDLKKMSTTTLDNITFLLNENKKSNEGDKETTSADDEDNKDDWSIQAAEIFETHGTIVFPSLISTEDCDALLSVVSDIISSKGKNDDDDNDDENELDFTSETRNALHRIHMALPLSPPSKKDDFQSSSSSSSSSSSTHTILSKITKTLYPLLSRILQIDTEEKKKNERIPLLGAGFMTVHPNATQQVLHKDVHGYDRHDFKVSKMSKKASSSAGGEEVAARAISIQIQLTDTTVSGGENKGSLEVLPGSHRPDGYNGNPTIIQSAIQEEEGTKDDDTNQKKVIQVNVPAGTVTIYSSRLWHRGGSNDSLESRFFCFLTLMEDNANGGAPPGLVHTMAKEDVGKWVLDVDGILNKVIF